MQAAALSAQSRACISRPRQPQAPSRRAVVARAAVEAEKQSSVNGSGKAAALDFDELTELIK